MSSRPWSFVVLLVLGALCLCGCSRRVGDKPIASGDGLGRYWIGDAQGKVRYAVENCFTRDIILELDGQAMHYELSVPPVRNRFVIVPAYPYRVSLLRKGSTATAGQFEVVSDTDGSVKGFIVRTRP